MSNAKSAYSVISGYYSEQVVPSSQKDKNRYDRSKRREQKYNEEWKKEKVNVNEIVDKYAPDAESYRDGVKFYFEGKENTVMCDMVGGYLRVKNNATGLFYRADGSLTDSNEGTHFKIKKWEEM